MAQGILNKIYLLSWKNFVLLKRHYIVTILEIVLPTLFTIALAYIRSQVKPAPQFDYGYDFSDPSRNPTGFPEHNEEVSQYVTHPSSI